MRDRPCLIWSGCGIMTFISYGRVGELLMVNSREYHKGGLWMGKEKSTASILNVLGANLV